MDETVRYYHKQIKLPLFPVHYDVFMLNDIHLGPAVVSNKYPGVSLDGVSSALSVTAVAGDEGDNKGVIILMTTDRSSDEPTVQDTIAFEATNLCWHILDLLQIKITIENCKIHAYIIEDISRELNKMYKEFLEKSEDDSDIDDSDDNIDDL